MLFRSVCLCLSLSVSVCLSLSLSRSFCLSVSLSLSLSVSVSVRLSACMSVRRSVGLSVGFSVCRSVGLAVCLSVCRRSRVKSITRLARRRLKMAAAPSRTAALMNQLCARQPLGQEALAHRAYSQGCRSLAVAPSCKHPFLEYPPVGCGCHFADRPIVRLIQPYGVGGRIFISPGRPLETYTFA